MKGACGCGSVKYQLSSDIKNIVNCHCTMCRAHNGSAFSTYAALPFKSLEIVAGEQYVQKYSASESAQKYFCGRCGTPMFNLNEQYAGVCMIFLGTLEQAQYLVPKINVWCQSKLAWVDAVEDIASLEQGFERK